MGYGKTKEDGSEEKQEDGEIKEGGSEKKKDYRKVVNRLALSLFVRSLDDKINTGFHAPPHLLALLHSFITGKLEEQAAETTDTRPFSTITVDSREVTMSPEKRALKRCATKLEAAGVRIKIPKAHRENSKQARLKYGFGFDFDIGFESDSKKLVIPQLHVTGRMEANWRNFIAWEQNRCHRAQFIPPEKDENRVSCKFSWYALFIQGLICCEHDIQLLIDRKVIEVHDDAYGGINQDKKKKKKINKELLLMFNGIAKGVDRHKVCMDSDFDKIFQKLNEHKSTSNLLMEKFTVFWHYFRRLLTWLGGRWEKSYAILKIEHTPTVWKKIGIVYAVALLFLTIAQVVLQAISI